MELNPQYRSILPTNNSIQPSAPITQEEMRKRVALKKQRDAHPVSKYKAQHEALHRWFESVVRLRLPTLYQTMQAEYKFHPRFKYLFDYCWVQYRVAVEIQGGIYARGRKSGHTSIPGMERDMVKLNLAQANGWILLQLSPRKIKKSPAYVQMVIEEAVKVQQQRGLT